METVKQRNTRVGVIPHFFIFFTMDTFEQMRKEREYTQRLVEGTTQTSLLKDDKNCFKNYQNEKKDTDKNSC